ncbi:guanine nucleotide-binding protein beta SU like protein (nucleomorph) [Chroomonas mesostigmatica CCMP1168]|uniref:Guanine nucleotide-binding protein beta SU like protein n=1 Tax=Chroomonas mesostigmatica CCMP1168 TaxID=1195612 RepID=J7G2Y1_9CRYP|nr:guanine nucleotide-binding protein beta SU like protein [Chroomonas mesostigmatica CCMP1168]
MWALGNEIKKQFGQCYNGGSILFVSDHKKFLFSSGNFISIVDLVNKKIQPLKFRSRSNILVFDIDKTGKFLTVVDDTNLLLVITLDDSVIINKIILKDKCFCLKWSPFKKYIVLGIKKFIQVWKTSVFNSSLQTSFQLSRTYGGHYGDVSDIDWNFSGDFFISGGSDGLIKIFSFRKKTRFCQLNFGNLKEKIIFVKFYTFSNKFLILYQNNILHTYQILIKKNQKKQLTLASTKKLHSSKLSLENLSITCIWVNFFSKFLFIGNSRGNVEIIIIPEFIDRKKKQKKTKTTFRILHKIQFSSFSLSNINAISVCKNNNFIVIGNYKQGKVIVYDQNQKKPVLTYDNTIFGSNCISTSPNDKLSIIGNLKGIVSIWSIQKGFCIIKFRSHYNGVNRVLFFKNSSRLAISSSKDSTVKIYDVKKSLVIRTLNFLSESNDFDSITCSYSGFFVASACRKTFCIYLWSLKTGEIVDILKGHNENISDLFFLEKKMKIISGSLDKTFRIWNFEKNPSFRAICFCEIFKTHNSILNIKLNPTFNEIALLIKNDSVFFFDYNMHICLSRIRKGFYFLFKKTRDFRNFSSKFSLIYSFNGKIILIGNSTRKIFSFSRRLPIFVKIYNIPFFQNNSRVVDSFFYSKKKKKKFVLNYVISLHSSEKKDDWVALTRFGVFLFQIKYFPDFFFQSSYSISCEKFDFFLDKTFFWIYYWKKKIKPMTDFNYIFRKIFVFFIYDRRKNITFSSVCHQIIKIFIFQKNFSIKEIYFLFNLLSKNMLDKYLNQAKKIIIKKFKSKILKKIDRLTNRLFFFIKIKQLMNSF